VLAWAAYAIVSNHHRASSHSWTYAEWLISYSGGFQRRGLSGSVFIWTSDVLGVDVLNVVFIAQISFIFLCLFLLFNLLTASPVPLIVFLGVISPLGTLYFLSDPAVVGRKEVFFYIFALAWVLFQIKGGENSKFKPLTNLMFVSFGLWLLAALLIHEGFVFFLPLLFLAVLAKQFATRADKLHWYKKSLITFSAPAIVAIISTTLIEKQASFEELCNPLIQRNLPVEICGGAVSWATFNGFGGLIHNFNSVIANPGTSFNYVIVWILCVAPFFYTLFRHPTTLVNKNHKMKIAVAVGISLVATLPIYAIALDWGRFTSVTVSLLSYLSLGMVNKVHSQMTRTANLGQKQPIIQIFALITLIGFWWVSFGIDHWQGQHASIGIFFMNHFHTYLSLIFP
jgi:hypothetical protein